MNYQDLIHEAIEVVLAWDLPDEALGGAVQAQAEFMAGLSMG